MKLRNYIWILSGLFSCVTAAQAQTEQEKLNQYDNQGQRHGFWYTAEPASKGEPASSAFGTYNHGSKTGIWYTADNKGNILAIEQFKYNLRDGEVKYFENGQLTCVGHYKGLNPSYQIDTVLIVHPITGEEKMVYVPTERGSVKHGRWRFYDELSGRLLREQQYQVDELIESRDFSVTAADSLFYEQRNNVLPHIKKPQYRHKQKEPAKSLISR